MTPRRSSRQLACATYSAPLAPGWGASLAQTHHYADPRPVAPVALPDANERPSQRVLRELHAARNSLPPFDRFAAMLGISQTQVTSALVSLRTYGHIRLVMGGERHGWGVRFVESGIVRTTAGAPEAWLARLGKE